MPRPSRKPGPMTPPPRDPTHGNPVEVLNPKTVYSKLAGRWVTSFSPLFPIGELPASPQLGRDYEPGATMTCLVLSANGTLHGESRRNGGKNELRPSAFQGNYVVRWNNDLTIFEGEFHLVRPTGTTTGNFFVQSTDELVFVLEKSIAVDPADQSPAPLAQGTFRRVKLISE